MWDLIIKKEYTSQILCISSFAEVTLMHWHHTSCVAYCSHTPVTNSASNNALRGRLWRWHKQSKLYIKMPDQYQRTLVITVRRSNPHDDVIKWKHFPRYWPFVRGIHRSPVNSPHKGQWRGALMFTLICARINVWVNNRKAGDLRRNCVHYDVIIMIITHCMCTFVLMYLYCKIVN